MFKLFKTKKDKKSDFEEKIKRGIDPIYGDIPTFKYRDNLHNLDIHLERFGISETQGNIFPIQIEIQNTTDEIKQAVLFGNNRNLLNDNFGSDKGIKVRPIQSNLSYLEVLQSISHDPIKVSLIRIQSSDYSQVTQVITMNYKEPNGTESSIPIITQSYFSAMQMQAGVIDVPF